MASVSLDSQILFTLPMAADGKPTSRRIWDQNQNRDSSVASSRASKKLQQDTYNPRRSTAGASQDDAILVSSDDESDWGDLEDSESDISFPPIEELFQTAKRRDSESGSAAGADKSCNAALGTSGDINAVEPSVTGEADLDDEIASSRHPQICGLQRSPAPLCSPALARLSPASPEPLQVEQDQPIPAGSGSCKEGHTPALEDSTFGKPAEEMSRASPPGAESQHMPSPDCFPRPSPPRLEEASDRGAMPCRDSACESDGDGDAEPPRVKPKSGRTRAALRHGIRRSNDRPSVDSDEAEAVQQSDDPDEHSSPRRHLGRRRRHDSTGAGDDDNMYYPPGGSEREQEEKEGDNIRPLPRKRRKISSPIQSTLLRRSTRQQIRSDAGTSQSQVQTSAPGRKRSSPRSLPSPPSSQGSSVEKGTVQVPLANFEEWPLQNAVLKRATVNGLATFQLQFTWDSCANHRREHRTSRYPRYKSPVNRRSSTKQGAPTRVAFTPEEDDLLIKLKNQELSWKQIHMQFTDAFPQRQRSVGGLQVRYCTKLKERRSSEGSRR